MMLLLSLDLHKLETRQPKKTGFSAPTPIPAQSWAIAHQLRYIVAIAKRGCGKTLGYLFLGFIHLKRKCNNPTLGPTILVLSPRELATQVHDKAVKVGSSSNISCTCLYGDAPKGSQLKDLYRGVDVVVATRS
ncbi:RNA helicase [Handroanthus impetiginosus]|uniref:RNA helicase n=1 Tax=Handroanthus impetiginosus TaxID=429701 RepID=A0A2G9G4E0_9LAMI|nr:RNA helicase [Handroanthus impetiginosus]